MDSVRDMFIPGMFGRTPLHDAALNPNECSETVEALVNAGADVNAQDTWKITPLNLAAICRNKNVIEVLLKCKADVNTPEWMGRTPLHNAAFSLEYCRPLVEYENHLLIVKSLLQNGAHVNSFTYDHETPLMLAVKGLHLGIIKELLLWGADVHVRNDEFQTCLHVAYEASIHPDFNYDIFLELLKHGACTECFDENGKTVLNNLLQSWRPEKLEEAKAFIKAAVLVNMGHWTEYSLNGRKNDRLYEFMEECVKEVVRMKSIQLCQSFSLCDFALRSDCDRNHECALERNIFDRFLEIPPNFPIYNDFIEVQFQRSYLLEKLLGMNVYAICKKGKVYLELYLNFDIMDLICSFLEDKDLLKFLKSFTESLH